MSNDPRTIIVGTGNAKIELAGQVKIAVQRYPPAHGLRLIFTSYEGRDTSVSHSLVLLPAERLALAIELLEGTIHAVTFKKKRGGSR